MSAKQISLIFIVSLLFLGCGDIKKPKKPDNLIPKDKMTNILYDLYLINSAKGVNKKQLESMGFLPEQYMLTKYNIDSLQFSKSNDYYAFDTETYKKIVENVKDRLEKEKEKYEELQKIEGIAAKQKRDSLKDLNKSKKPKKLIEQKLKSVEDSIEF